MWADMEMCISHHNYVSIKWLICVCILMLSGYQEVKMKEGTRAVDNPQLVVKGVG